MATMAKAPGEEDTVPGVGGRCARGGRSEDVWNVPGQRPPLGWGHRDGRSQAEALQEPF